VRRSTGALHSLVLISRSFAMPVVTVCRSVHVLQCIPRLYSTIDLCSEFRALDRLLNACFESAIPRPRSLMRSERVLTADIDRSCALSTTSHLRCPRLRYAATLGQDHAKGTRVGIARLLSKTVVSLSASSSRLRGQSLRSFALVHQDRTDHPTSQKLCSDFNRWCNNTSKTDESRPAPHPSWPQVRPQSPPA
jgi:hypothetical protein